MKTERQLRRFYEELTLQTLYRYGDNPPSSFITILATVAMVLDEDKLSNPIDHLFNEMMQNLAERN